MTPSLTNTALIIPHQGYKLINYPYKFVIKKIVIFPTKKRAIKKPLSKINLRTAFL